MIKRDCYGGREIFPKIRFIGSFSGLILATACSDGSGEEPIVANSDINPDSGNREIFIFIVAQTELPGDYSICFRKLSDNNCMDSDSDGTFESMKFGVFPGDSVAINATKEGTDFSCNVSIPVQKNGNSIAVTVSFPRTGDCEIEWGYRLS